MRLGPPHSTTGLLALLIPLSQPLLASAAAAAPFAADLDVHLPSSTTPTTSTPSTPNTNARGLALADDALTRLPLPKDKAGVPAFLAHLHAMQLGHSDISDYSGYSGFAVGAMDALGSALDLGTGVNSASASMTKPGKREVPVLKKTGVEGENVDVLTGEEEGTTIGVHDLDVNPDTEQSATLQHAADHAKGIQSQVVPMSNGIRRRSKVAGRMARIEYASDPNVWDADSEQEQDQDGDGTEGDADDHEQERDQESSESQRRREVQEVYRPRQATRAQVIARHKWKRANGGAFEPAPSGQSLNCAAYTKWDLRLTRASDGKPFVVPDVERDSSAHVGDGAGTVFKLYEDCALCVPREGDAGRGVCANISPGRKRDVLYFDKPTDIIMNDFAPAACTIQGGGAAGPMTCSIPREPGVNKFCLLTDSTLVIREGLCDPQAGESAVKITATIR